MCRLDCSDQKGWDEDDVKVLRRRKKFPFALKMEDINDGIAVVGIGCHFPGGLNNI